MRQDQLDIIMKNNPALRISGTFEKIAIEPQKKNKFNAQKTWGNASKAENTRARDLRWLEIAWEISGLQEQVNFVLQEAFIDNEGKKIRAITYTPDFVYRKKDGKMVAEEKKWFETEAYVLRKKLFKFKFPEYIFLQT